MEGRAGLGHVGELNGHGRRIVKRRNVDLVGRHGRKRWRLVPEVFQTRRRSPPTF
jgi:hypothetical protein